mgnify:CR=1 FL=1
MHRQNSKEPGKDFASLPVMIEDEILPYSDIHGSGCCFASAIASYIALGYPVYDAVAEAKKFVTGAIKYSVEYCKGRRTMNPFWQIHQTYHKKY